MKKTTIDLNDPVVVRLKKEIKMLKEGNQVLCDELFSLDKLAREDSKAAYTEGYNAGWDEGLDTIDENGRAR